MLLPLDSARVPFLWGVLDELIQGWRNIPQQMRSEACTELAHRAERIGHMQDEVARSIVDFIAQTCPDSLEAARQFHASVGETVVEEGPSQSSHPLIVELNAALNGKTRKGIPGMH